MSIQKPDFKKLGRIVEQAIQANGCKSHREFERLTGIGQGTIGRWINGTASMMPDYTTLYKLSKYCDYSVEELQAIARGKEEELEPVREVVTALDAWEYVSQLSRKEMAALGQMILAELAKN